MNIFTTERIFIDEYYYYYMIRIVKAIVKNKK